MYAWEENFQKKALSLRKEETKQLRKSGDIVDWLNFVYNCTPPMVSEISTNRY